MKRNASNYGSDTHYGQNRSRSGTVFHDMMWLANYDVSIKTKENVKKWKYVLDHHTDKFVEIPKLENILGIDHIIIVPKV